ncbi:MAG TPA: DUF2852 domain-containing protein [Xanthobacteraceae bacterium]|nr:DUF2852 domain-containing protein [Xanthobacteraceae bacterium]
MPITAKIDEMGRPAWIALMVLGFIIWWPLGLATLVYMFGSGRMGCSGYGGGNGRWQHKMERMQAKMDRMRERMGGSPGGSGPSGFGFGGWGGQPSSGNSAFDEYRTETLRRLEEEQREFKEFLERLRFAKDKTEFDQFMAQRRPGGTGDTPPPAES